jgi:2-polyprenyl-6-methoxyphenol hydroxylase-like FAD-dependent oxidoreductase
MREFDRHPVSCARPCTTSTSKESAVVLLGDAVHANPPDMGEDVNAALGDVAALSDALERNDDNNNAQDGDSRTLDVALEEFESERLPEVRIWNIIILTRILFVGGDRAASIVCGPKS